MRFLDSLRDMMNIKSKKRERIETAVEAISKSDENLKQPKKLKKNNNKRQKRIMAITKNIKAPKPVEQPSKHTVKCPTDVKHTCIATELINRTIQMIEDFEANIQRIENNQMISKEMKSDIQHYINKNIVTAIWVISPAFPHISLHKRCKEFKAVYDQAIEKRSPGILDLKKHIE